MNQEERLKALLDLIESYRTTRCDKLLSTARAEARAVLREARREARERVRQILAAERSRANGQIALAEARLRTRRRLYEQRRLTGLLEQGWAQLVEELERRWKNPASRRIWVGALADCALRILPQGPWQIAHPPGWPPEEREELASRLKERLQFHTDESIRAGLCISCGHNVVDGTLSGLISDRQAVESRLLQILQGKTD
jgi:hypothetical protein